MGKMSIQYPASGFEPTTSWMQVSYHKHETRATDYSFIILFYLRILYGPNSIFSLFFDEHCCLADWNVTIFVLVGYHLYKSDSSLPSSTLLFNRVQIESFLVILFSFFSTTIPFLLELLTLPIDIITKVLQVIIIIVTNGVKLWQYKHGIIDQDLVCRGSANCSFIGWGQSKVFLKCAILLFVFLVFSQKIQILKQINLKNVFTKIIQIWQHINVKKCPSSFRSWNSNCDLMNISLLP